MKINLHIPGLASEPSLPHATLPIALALAAAVALVLLPGEALFLVILSGMIGLGINLAELRRHGGPGVPFLPLTPEH